MFIVPTCKIAIPIIRDMESSSLHLSRIYPLMEKKPNRKLLSPKKMQEIEGGGESTVTLCIQGTSHEHSQLQNFLACTLQLISWVCT